MARKNFVGLVVIVVAFFAVNQTQTLAARPITDGGGGGTPVTYDQTFSASSNSSCAANLRWTLQTGFTPTANFTVERALNSSFSSPTFSSASIGTLSTVDQALTPGTTYYYGIKGISSLSSYTLPTPASITTPALSAAPSPSNTKANISAGNAVIQFDASALPSVYGGFTLTRRIGSGTPQTLFDGAAVPISGTTFGYSDSSYSASNVNTYSVTFFESAFGCAASSRSVSPAMAVVVPGMPSGVGAVSATNPTMVTLSWAAGAGQTYAEVMRQTGGGGWTLLATTPSNSLSDSAVTLGNTYSYKVRACSNVGGNIGCSDFSAPITKTISSGSVVIESMNLKARAIYSGASSGDVYLEWDNAHPNTSYSVDRTMLGILSSIPVSAASSPRLSVTMKNLSTSTQLFQVNIPSALIVSEQKQVNLAAKIRFTGHAWANTGSSGIGWIDMSCDPAESGSCSSGNRYNVFADSANVLHGVAWASTRSAHGFAWLSFNQDDLVGCPDGASNPNNCIAKLDTSVTPARLVGWAKFLGAAGTGTWGDGWISLSSLPASSIGLSHAAPAFASGWNPFSPKQIWNAFVTRGSFTSLHGIAEKIASTVSETGRIVRAYAQSGVNYGVTYDTVTQTLGGQAWGGQVSGWISFNPSVGGAPVVSNVVLSEGSLVNPNRTGSIWCDEDPYYAVKWTYAGGAAQQQAKVTFYNGKSGTPYVATTSTAYGQYNLFKPLDILAPNTSFTVGVQAFDGTAWSPEVKSAPMTTPSYYAPLVYFNWNPTPAKTAWPINFSGTSTIDRSGGVSPMSSWRWLWTFVNTTSSTNPTKSTATAIFDPNTATANDVVKLTVTDSKNTCGLSQQVLGGTAVQPKKIQGIQER